MYVVRQAKEIKRTAENKQYGYFTWFGFGFQDFCVIFSYKARRVVFSTECAAAYENKFAPEVSAYFLHGEEKADCAERGRTGSYRNRADGQSRIAEQEFEASFFARA